jgi:hypothetical protein
MSAEPEYDWYLEGLPDGRGVHFPPPNMTFDEYIDWLDEQHQDRVRRGVLDRIYADPLRCPVDAPFRLD